MRPVFKTTSMASRENSYAPSVHEKALWNTPTAIAFSSIQTPENAVSTKLAQNNAALGRSGKRTCVHRRLGPKQLKAAQVATQEKSTLSNRSHVSSTKMPTPTLTRCNHLYFAAPYSACKFASPWKLPGKSTRNSITARSSNCIDILTRSTNSINVETLSRSRFASTRVFPFSNML
jgi:hypothetical protein